MVAFANLGLWCFWNNPVHENQPEASQQWCIFKQKPVGLVADKPLFWVKAREYRWVMSNAGLRYRGACSISKARGPKLKTHQHLRNHKVCGQRIHVTSGVRRKFSWGESFRVVWWSFAFGVRCLWRYNLTSYSCVETNVLAKFVDIIRILFCTHSP